MRVLTLDPDADRADVVAQLWFAPDGRTLAGTVGPPRLAQAVHFWDLAADREADREDLDTSRFERYAAPAVSHDLTRLAYHAFQNDSAGDFIVVKAVGKGPMLELGSEDDGLAVRRLTFAPDGGTLLAV